MAIRKLYYGVDAQPIENFDWVVSLGANALHRYDSGPQKNVKVVDWVPPARARGLSYILQGTKCDEQGYDMGAADPNLISIAHDDEPDLNRWNPNLTKEQQPSIYAPGEVNPNMVGWTRTEILAQRYAKWRSQLGLQNAGVPVSVNFNGTMLTNPWTEYDKAFQIPYIKASDEQGCDVHVFNNKPTGWKLYFLLHAFRRIGFFGGNPQSIYFECANEALNTTGGRSPTPAEQSTQLWGAIMYGATQVWAFPQKIGKPFAYKNVAPENELRIKRDFALLKKYEKFILNGSRTIVESPVFTEDPKKGTITYPTIGAVTWSLNGESFKVELDFIDKNEPKFYEPNSGLNWESKFNALQIEYDLLNNKYNAVIGDFNTMESDFKALKLQFDDLKAANNSLTEQVVHLQSDKADLVKKVAVAAEAWKTLNNLGN